MPTYYLQPGQHAHVYQRPRAYSQSYGQQGPQQIFYTHSTNSSRGQYAYPTQSSGHYASPQYLTPSYQYDSGRHHHQGHARSGSGGVHYPSSAPSRQHDSSRHSPSSSHHSAGRRSSSSHRRHHRSQSVPRQSVQVLDARSHHHRSSSRPRQSPSHSSHRDRPVGEPLSERIRRMFGFGGHSSSRNQHRDYVDARSGRTVDWRGRPIYRV